MSPKKFKKFEYFDSYLKFKKTLKFELFLQYLLIKCTNEFHPGLILYRILRDFNLFSSQIVNSDIIKMKRI